VKTLAQKFTMVVATLALAGVGVLAAYAAGTQTLTGEVSDSMCGAKHMMADKAACTRACVQKGSKYALVSGDKVYTIESSDKAVQDKLNSLAGQKAKVTGDVSGDTITASKVVAAK
jgi:hypothetical protein